MDSPLEHLKLLAKAARTKRSQASTLNMIAQKDWAHGTPATHIYTRNRRNSILDCFALFFANEELPIVIEVCAELLIESFTWACIIFLGANEFCDLLLLAIRRSRHDDDKNVEQRRNSHDAELENFPYQQQACGFRKLNSDFELKVLHRRHN